GTRRNVVPENADAIIDVRVATHKEAERIDGVIKALQPQLRNTSISITGGINRPPMEKKSSTARLFNIAKKEAEKLNFSLKEAAVGGSSDGNFTSALGIPTLDGLGAVGDGPHAENEHIIIEELVQ